MLRTVELDFPDTPVLPIVKIVASTAYYHGIYDGKPLSYKEALSGAELETKSIRHIILPGGMTAIVVNQGVSSQIPWSDAAPTPQEIKTFQLESGPVLHNKAIEDLAQEFESTKTIEVPMLACHTKLGNKETLYYVSSKFTRRRRPEFLPSEYAKMVGQLAMGGYWYSAVKGVSFRAYMRGLYGQNNIWPVPILGWRMSSTVDPDYRFIPPEGGDLQFLAIVGGVDSEEDLAGVNVSAYSHSVGYVDREGLHLPTRIVKLDYSFEVKSLIQTVNGGSTLFNDTGLEYLFLDARFPAARNDMRDITVEDAVAELEKIANNQYDWSDSW